MNDIYDTLTRLRSLADQVKYYLFVYFDINFVYKVVAGRTNQQQYAKEEENSKKKLLQLQGDLETIVATL